MQWADLGWMPGACQTALITAQFSRTVVVVWDENKKIKLVGQDKESFNESNSKSHVWKQRKPKDVTLYYFPSAGDVQSLLWKQGFVAVALEDKHHK